MWDPVRPKDMSVKRSFLYVLVNHSCFYRDIPKLCCWMQSNPKLYFQLYLVLTCPHVYTHKAKRARMLNPKVHNVAQRASTLHTSTQLLTPNKRSYCFFSSSQISVSVCLQPQCLVYSFQSHMLTPDVNPNSCTTPNSTQSATSTKWDPKPVCVCSVHVPIQLTQPLIVFSP